MNVMVDSWAWMELFSQGRHAQRVADELSKHRDVYVSVMTLFEVGRKIQKKFGVEARRKKVRFMLQKAWVTRLTIEEAFSGFELCLEHDLHTTDALIYASTVTNDCVLLTGDPHFKGKPGVIYVGD